MSESLDFFSVAAPYLAMTRQLHQEGATEEYLLKAIVCALVLEAEHAKMKLPEVLAFVDKAYKLSASVKGPLLN